MVVYRTTFEFDSIYFVESIPNGDLQTGTELYERVVAPWGHLDGFKDVQLRKFPTAAELFNGLTQIRELVRKFARSPILVLDAHGSSKGIELASGEFVDWRALARPFAEINEACRCNLVIVSSMCFGTYMQSVLLPSDRTPAFAIIGPTDEIAAGELLDLNVRLFDHFLKNHDLMAALRHTNGDGDLKSWPLQFLLAEILFCHVYNHYLAVVATPERDEERINTLVARLVRRGVDLLQAGAERARIRHILGKHDFWYDHLRKKFLMIDQFPENAPRFGLTFEKCRGIALKASE